MSYLLDTNVISEIFRTNPDKAVVQWLQSIPAQELYLSVLTLGEIRKGVEQLRDSKRKQRIIEWLERDLVNFFEERVLPIDAAVADKWGFILSHHKSPLPAIDSLISATALVHNLKIVTRNVRDFQFLTLEVINPWEF